jgi:ubiquitin-protein ligase
MDLLTQSGWSPVNSIESILIQIRTEMVEGGGRLDLANQRPYTVEEVR